MKKNCQEFECVFGIADQNYKSIREIEMTECLMESVSAKSLDAKDGKSMQQITCEFAVGDVKYVNGSGSVIKGNLSNKAKSWQTSYWDVLGLYNIPAESITKIDLPKHTVKMVEEHTSMRRLPTKTSGAYTCEGLKVSGSAAHNGYEAARDLCIKLMYDGVLTENEFQDWSVNVKDPSHKKVLGEILFIQSAPFKFTTGAEAKVGDAPLQWEMEMFCEQSFWKIAEKAM
ncbi:MAG: hypothetical protein IPL61_01835 [Myxococcales bacterium]|nr:hypothetical protein [Myxococcales bacterium]